MRTIFNDIDSIKKFMDNEKNDQKARLTIAFCTGIIKDVTSKTTESRYPSFLMAKISVDTSQIGLSFPDLCQYFYDNYETKHLATFASILSGDLESMEIRTYETDQDLAVIKKNLERDRNVQ